MKCGQPSNEEAASVVSRTYDNRATSVIYDFTVTELPENLHDEVTICMMNEYLDGSCKEHEVG